MLNIPSVLDPDLERLIHKTIGCCIEVHRQIGPGLLEAIYQRAMALELQAANIPFEREKPYPGDLQRNTVVCPSVGPGR